MKRSEVKELLHQLADGELEPAREEQVRLALGEYPDCQAELAEIEAIGALAREAFLAPVEDVDLAGVFDGVMARLEEAPEAAPAETAIDGIKVQRNVEEDQPGLLERFGQWLGEVFRLEHPMAAAAGFAALLAVVGGLWFAMGNADTTPDAIGPSTPEYAKGDKAGDAPKATPNTRRRRGMEGEQPMTAGAVQVESFEVAEGRIEIEDSDGDEGAVVVWHLDEEPAEGEQAPSQPDSTNEKGL